MHWSFQFVSDILQINTARKEYGIDFRRPVLVPFCVKHFVGNCSPGAAQLIEFIRRFVTGQQYRWCFRLKGRILTRNACVFKLASGERISVHREFH